MVNACFSKLFGAFSVDRSVTGTTAPIIELNPDNLKCSLFADVAYYDDSLTTPIEIFFNSRLFELFSSFPNIFYSYDGDLNYKLVVHNNNGTNLTKVTNPSYGLLTSPSTFTYVQMYQEISTVSLWNPVASIVFCSTMLPIYPTQTSKPNIIDQ